MGVAPGRVGAGQTPNGEHQGGQHSEGGQGSEGHDGIGGEGPEVGRRPRGVVEHRGGVGRSRRLDTRRPPPRGHAAGLLEGHGDEPDGHGRDTGGHGHAQSGPSSGGGDHRDQGEQEKGLHDGLAEAGQQPEGHRRADPVPAAGTGPPGHIDEQRTGQGVEGVGGHDRAAEPDEGTGGHDQPGGQAHPSTLEIATGQCGHARGRRRCQRRDEDQAVHHAEAEQLVDDPSAGHVQPVTGWLGLSVGDVVVPDGRRVLRRVPVGGPGGCGQQPEDQGDDSGDDGHGRHLQAPARRLAVATRPGCSGGRAVPGRDGDAGVGVCVGGLGRRGVEGHDSGYRDPTSGLCDAEGGSETGVPSRVVRRRRMPWWSSRKGGVPVSGTRGLTPVSSSSHGQGPTLSMNRLFLTRPPGHRK